MRSFLKLCIAVWWTAWSSVASADVNTSERVFDPAVRSVSLSCTDHFLDPPVINLSTGRKLLLSFDILGYDRDYLQYRLIHCNADWQPSQLLDHEFASGFNACDITDFGFSSNTFQHFVNYHVEIPSEGGVAPLVSGNYLLQVVRTDNPDDVLLQVRFSVVDPQVNLRASASPTSLKGSHEKWQQVDVSAIAKQSEALDPFADYTLVVEQNRGAMKATATAERPTSLSAYELSFTNHPKLTFNAGNEFRRFETVNLAAPGIHVDSIRFVNGLRHVWLSPDYPKTNYAFDRTQHGRFKVRELNATDSDLGADYCIVHFTLRSPELKNQRVILDGEFAQSLSPEERTLSYDHIRQAYTVEVPLKQGSYNYRYCIIPYSEAASIDGDFHQTANQYNIYLFQRKPGWRADKLIGYSSIFSN